MNEISTISCDTSYRTSSIKPKKQKNSFETFEANMNDDHLEMYHKRHLSPKWYFRIKNSKKLSWLYYLINRVFICRKDKNLNQKLSSKSIDYSKCKLYYKSNKTLNHDSSTLNCKYCQNKLDYSLYTIVIKLNKPDELNKCVLNVNQNIDEAIESEPFIENKLIIRQYPRYSFKSSDNLSINHINFNNISCKSNFLIVYNIALGLMLLLFLTNLPILAHYFKLTLILF